MTTVAIRLPRAPRDDSEAHRTRIVMTTATIGLLQQFKPMTTATITGHACARGPICYGYGMTTAAQRFAQRFARHDYMTTGRSRWRHVAVQHICLGNGCLGNGCLVNGCLGNGCLVNDCLGKGGVGPAAGRSRWRRVREQNFFLRHAVTPFVATIKVYSRA